MLTSTLLSLAVAVSGVAARRCRDIVVPVSLSSRNAVFDLKPLVTEVDVTDFYLNLARQGSSFAEKLQTGWATVEGEYKLAATYCEPDAGPGPVLQIMTHGVGFDRSYFDFPVQDHTYSYVARAVDEHGYSTLTWDRLGVGQSSRGETINEIQLALEVAALRELTRLFAKGKVTCRTGNITHAYGANIVHMGHSFGAAMTYALVRETPEVSAGIILTGYSQIPDYMAHFALGGNFVPVSSIPFLALSGYPKGYVGAGARMGVHINFFGPTDFDEEVLDHLWIHGQPNTPGEILTVGFGGGETNHYTGPVMIITGERDVPFCGGDCLATGPIANSASNLIEASRTFFPDSSAFNATVVPAAGHGLFLGYSGFSAFDSILEFLDAQL